MNLDELQSVQARERQSSDLQHLRSSFYREVGEFINSLNEERARVVEAADDPFSEPEVRRLTDDIETAEGTVEAIYERRVGKVVKKASIAAAGMPIEDDGLTSEEEALFEDLVARIESNRETILSILDGEAPTVSCSIDEETPPADPDEFSPEDGRHTADTDRTPDADPPTDDAVSAADLMGDSADTAPKARPVEDEPESPPIPDPDQDSETTDLPPTVSAESGGKDRPRSGETSRREAEGDGDGDGVASETNDASSKADSDREGERIPGLPRTTVRITADIGEIVGADDRDYDLGREDVVTLPEPNANVLVEKDAAERLQ